MADQRWDMSIHRCCPQPPPVLSIAATSDNCERLTKHSCCMADNLARDLLHRLFADGYRADVCVYTNDGIILAHASILGMASLVIKTMLKQSKRRGGRRRAISIRGVPHNAVRIFIRFLYTSCYEEEDMNEFVLHLLVLLHAFVIPSLKKVCVQQLERGLLTTENVVDALQLVWLCDVPPSASSATA